MTGKNYKWLVLALLSFAFFFNQADRGLFGLLTIPIQEELNLTDLQIGCVNTALFVTLAFTVPLAGILGDRFNRKWVITGAILFWSFMTAATAWVAFAPCEHSAFFPVSSATTGFDPDWESDSPSGADRSWRERKAAGTVLRRLGTLARIDRIRLGAGVRDYWRDVERRHLAAWPKVEAAALSCGDENLAARIMTDYTVAAQREIYAAAVRITDDLLDYLDDNTETMTWRVIKGGVGIEPGKPIPPFAVKGGTK